MEQTAASMEEMSTVESALLAGAGGLFGWLLANTVAAGARASRTIAGGLRYVIGNVHGQSPFD